MHIDFQELIKYARARWKNIVIISVFVFALWITVYGDTLATNETRTILINNIYDK